MRNLTDKEILRFLSKHYLEDIVPKLSGLYKHKILAHGSADLSKLDVIDIDKYAGSSIGNKGHFGKGFYLSSDRRVATHYGRTQPIVLNDIQKPFYIIPGNKNYYGSHDFEGMAIRVFVDFLNLPEEEREKFKEHGYDHIYNNLKKGTNHMQVAYAQGIPELDKSWKQNGIKDAKKDLEHKLKSHYNFDDGVIKKLLDNARIEIEPLKDFAGLTGSKNCG